MGSVLSNKRLPELVWPGLCLCHSRIRANRLSPGILRGISDPVDKITFPLTSLRHKPLETASSTFLHSRTKCPSPPHPMQVFCPTVCDRLTVGIGDRTCCDWASALTKVWVIVSRMDARSSFLISGLGDVPGGAAVESRLWDNRLVVIFRNCR